MQDRAHTQRIDKSTVTDNFYAKLPLGRNALFVAITVDYQHTTPYDDLRLPLGNGAAKREQSQIHLSSAEQASHLKT